MYFFSLILFAFLFVLHCKQIRTENIDDNLPGHGAARVYGIIMDNCIVDTAPM